MRDAAHAREKMVREQIAARGVKDPRVIAAMLKIPRERFVGADDVERAYDDRPLPLGRGQTISQPYIVAKMAELAELQGGENVLEVGAGSGYLIAVLAELCGEVWGIEIIAELAATAKQRLAELGVTNAHVESFDGTYGWEAHAPYDAIVVSAGAPRVPVLLVGQLTDGGRLVLPVGPRDNQKLTVITRRGAEFESKEIIGVRFVDLTGHHGWGGRGPASA
jgi:protein-L-isoaspartate(D-aspartate) O-methyltransferase